MKKNLLITLFFLSLFTLITPPAHAVSLCPTDATFKGLCGLDVGKSISSFISFAYLIAVIAALIYLVWGGFRWLTSAGDKQNVQTAREHIIAAIVGLIIIFLSYVILGFIVKFFLPGFDIANITVPKFGQ